MAERACQSIGAAPDEGRFWGTLAAAYAETGKFEEAVRSAEKAIALATAAGQKEVAEKNQELLELYRKGKAYHEKGN